MATMYCHAVLSVSCIHVVLVVHVYLSSDSLCHSTKSGCMHCIISVWYIILYYMTASQTNFTIEMCSQSKKKRKLNSYYVHSYMLLDSSVQLIATGSIIGI